MPVIGPPKPSAVLRRRKGTREEREEERVEGGEAEVRVRVEERTGERVEEERAEGRAAVYLISFVFFFYWGVRDPPRLRHLMALRRQQVWLSVEETVR